jgi:hypothetical protein
MDYLFLAAADQLSATMAQAYPTWATTSGIETMADVITGLLMLGFGIFIYRLPPEKLNPDRGEQTCTGGHKGHTDKEEQGS